MKIATTLICGTLLTGVSCLAVAQDDYGYNDAYDQGSYFELQYGRSRLHDHSFDVPGGRITTDSNSGDVLLLNSGYQFAQWGFGSLRAEAELGYRSNGIDGQSFTPDGTTGKVTLANPSGHTQVWSLMFNAINDFRPGTGFDPYVGVGIGYARVDFHNYGVAPLGAGTQGVGLVDDVDGDFAYQGIVGFRSQLTQRLDLDVNWRYFTVNSLSLNNSADQSVGSDYTSSAIMVGLDYSF